MGKMCSALTAGLLLAGMALMPTGTAGAAVLLGPCTADIDGPPPGGPDGTVDTLDLLLVLAQWGTAGPEGDITGPGGVPDGIVDVLDLLDVIAQWGDCPVIGPPNDDCANAIPIADGATPYSTIGATTDGPVEPTCKFGGVTGNDIWFQYTASCTGDATVSTCNATDYDSDLVVYDGCDCAALVLLGCNDDGAGCAGFSSELTVPVVAGNCYLVRVGGWNEGDTGTGVLSIGCLAACVPTGAPNDCCVDAIPILDGITPYDSTGANTDGVGDPSCQFDGQTYHDLWFHYTATCDGTLNASTCNDASYDTDLVVYDGCNCATMTLLGCNDDGGGCAGFSSDVFVPVVTGNCYTVRAGGFMDGDFGAANLHMTCEPSVPAPPNDECAGAIEIFAGLNPYDTTGATTTTDPIDEEPFCSAGSGINISNDIWYTYIATDTGLLNLNTCEDLCGSATFDTDIWVYEGCDCATMQIIACNDDADGLPCGSGGATPLWHSVVEVPVFAGNCYTIRNGGWETPGDFGTGVLCVTLTPGPVNDFCAGATAIAPGGSASDSTIGRTVDAVPICGVIPSAAGVWYSTIGDGTTFTVSTCDMATDYDTYISVYEGTCANMACVASNDDDCLLNFVSSTVTWATQPCQQYLILIHGSGLAEGNFVLSLASDGIPVVPTCTVAAPGDILEGGICQDDGFDSDLDPNGGCNSTPDAFGGPIAFGDTIFGTVSTYTDAGGIAVRDTDWYLLPVVGGEPFTARVYAESEVQLSIVTDAISGDVATCTSPGIPAGLSTTGSGGCCVATLIGTIPAGQTQIALFVAPVTGSSVPCSGGLNNYRVTITSP